MASVAKPQPASGARRKSSKGPLIVTLKLQPTLLQRFSDNAVVKEESPSKDSSSATSNTLPVAASSNGDNPPASASNTPVASGTPVPTSSMPPPTEVPGPKKKGTKRGAGAALTPDGLPKPRGKPGPKKKARLEDGSIDHSATVPRAANGTAHKLGPKANQGAINAGLRALDRSGKPCRKWQKGSFKVKSFTGVIWEIPRWKAPPKITVENKPAEGSTSGDSSKENKDNSQVESEKSNSGPDVEMGNSNSTAPSQMASSPAPSNNPTTSAAVAAARPAPLAPEKTPGVTATA